MAVLANLKLTTEKRKVVYDQKSHRRQKMLEAIGEQKLLAEALINDEVPNITRMVTEKDPETGEKRKVMKPKRVRQWFWHNIDGTWFIEVRYGNKVLDLGKGKTAIEVADKDKLPEALDMLMEAVKAGELDAQMEKAGAKRLVG